MVNLEQLNLTEVQNVVNCYRNLLYHRTVILEGIRKVAFRNMAHLSEAMAYCESTGDTVRDHEWIERIQQKMLIDQGLEDNELNRILIGWATYYPLQVYLALLYAEVEFYQKFCNKSDVLADGVLSEYLSTKTEFISKLSKFRDFYLHPAKDNAPAELDLLSVEGSYNHAPELQRHLDEYLDRIRMKIQGSLNSILIGLPEIQRLYCILQFLITNLRRMDDFGDLEGMRHTARQLRELSQRLEEIAASPQACSAKPRQIRAGLILAELMYEVSPSAPEQQFMNLGAKQTPMTTLMLSPLVSGQAPDSYGDSRTAFHATENIGELRRIIITASVLINESLTVQGKHSLEQLLEYGKSMSEEELENFHWNEVSSQGLQQAREIASLSRVSTALLYEPLRLYGEVNSGTHTASRPTLDKLVTPTKLKNLRIYRNSVFHVLDPSQHPDEVDLVIIDPDFRVEIPRLFSDLAAFWGLGKQE